MTATERVQREVDIFFQGYWEGVRTMKEQNKIVKVCELKEESMKIEDCKNVNEFFGVELGGHIWVEGHKCSVWKDSIHIRDYESGYTPDGRALVGCLTGQLKWSTEPPKPEMTEDEKKILREIAAWFPWWDAVHLGRKRGIVYSNVNGNWGVPFDVADKGSKAYEVLAPILEKCGEIDLDNYRENNNMF